MGVRMKCVPKRFSVNIRNVRNVPTVRLVGWFGSTCTPLAGRHGSTLWSVLCVLQAVQEGQAHPRRVAAVHAPRMRLRHGSACSACRSHPLQQSAAMQYMQYVALPHRQYALVARARAYHSVVPIIVWPFAPELRSCVTRKHVSAPCGASPALGRREGAPACAGRVRVLACRYWQRPCACMGPAGAGCQALVGVAMLDDPAPP
jgi:hypothetical protein